MGNPMMNRSDNQEEKAMNNRMNNRRNGYGQRQENSPEGSWSPYREPSPYNTQGNRYEESYGQQSPIDFGQQERYSDPYREYEGPQGQRDYGSHGNRGDYRGNDAEFGYRQPGAPRFGSQGYESQQYGTTGQDWESPSFGSPYEERRNNPGYGPEEQRYSRQPYGSPYRGGYSQPGSRSWSEGYERPGTWERNPSSRFGGDYGEPRESSSWNQDRSHSDRTSRQPSWGSSAQEQQRGGWGESQQSGSSSYERPWQEGPYSGKGPKGYQRPDERIKEEVCERLSYHGFIDPSEVDINVEQGEVKISGTCMNRREKRMIEDVVDSVRGVRDVRNELSINQNRSDNPSGSSNRSESSNQGNTPSARYSSGTTGGSSQSGGDSSTGRKSTSKRKATT